MIYNINMKYDEFSEIEKYSNITCFSKAKYVVTQSLQHIV